MRTKLSSRGYEAAEIGRTLDRLAGRDLVSDERFAEAFLRSRLERGQGPLRIRAQLKERGVDAPLVDAVLNERRKSIGTGAQRPRAAAALVNLHPGIGRTWLARRGSCGGRGFSEGQVARAVLNETVR